VEQARAEGTWRLVEEFTQLWWIIACVSMQDPDERQRKWDTVDEIRDKVDRGEDIPGVPLEEILARRTAEPGIDLTERAAWLGIELPK
jgi:hypothetical protein